MEPGAHAHCDVQNHTYQTVAYGQLHCLGLATSIPLQIPLIKIGLLGTNARLQVGKVDFCKLYRCQLTRQRKFYFKAGYIQDQLQN